ncbi:MAG: HAMP domain-containing sensor histidine kinase [Candidatus Wallbacteria bacterium]|nr:HAMP domain-containing sensor histidine kinase [Candidatus Wallbacteria bacterium]
MKSHRRYLILSLLALFLLTLSFLTLKVTKVLKEQEIRQVFSGEDLKSEINGQIAFMVNRKIVPIGLVYDSEKPPINPAAPAEQFSAALVKMRDDYRAAQLYYQSGDYERALFYFEKISGATQFLGNFKGMENQVLFSQMFVYRIYRSIYLKEDKSLHQKIVSEFAKDCELDGTLREAMLLGNRDLFSTDEISYLRDAWEFHQKSWEKQIESTQQTEARSLFVPKEDLKRFYLVSAQEHGFKVDAVLTTDLEFFFKSLTEQFSGGKFRLRIPSATGDMIVSKAGISYALQLDPGYKNREERWISRKFVLLDLILLSAYFLAIFTVIRHLFLLEKLEKMKDDFLQIISHELKTPLSGIRLYADTIRTLENNDKIRGYAEIISSKSNQISNLISNLVYLNRLSDLKNMAELSENLRSSLTNVDVKVLIEGLCEEYANCYLKKYSLEISGSGIFPGDRGILEIIFANLIDNSFKHVESEPVMIFVKMDADCKHQITYSDNGKFDGTVSKLFSKFGHSRGTRKGLGLGLYIVRQLVELLGGSVTAETAGALKIMIKLGK